MPRSERPGPADLQTEQILTELTDQQYLVRYRVGPNQAGMRLDRFLKEQYRRRSREVLKKAIDTEAITLERRQGAHVTVGRLKSSTSLLEGDVVLVLSEKKVEPEVNFDYKVIFEDDSLFVVYKPPNLPVHPSGRFFFNTLLTHLKVQKWKERHAQELPTGRAARANVLDNDEFYYLAHRIDKETSGILVLTKNPIDCANIVAQFADRSTQKKYLAIVYGNPPYEFEETTAMGRSKTSRISLKMECMTEEEGGMPSSTRFRKLESRRGIVGEGMERRERTFSLLECTPKTGRQHQIRVHLERAGFPIVGDKLYGVDEEFALLFYERERLTPEAEARLILPRHALHSNELSFTHPKTGERLHFKSPLPVDLQAFWDLLGPT